MFHNAKSSNCITQILARYSFLHPNKSTGKQVGMQNAEGGDTVKECIAGRQFLIYFEEYS